MTGRRPLEEHSAKVTLRLHGFPAQRSPCYYGDSDLLALQTRVLLSPGRLNVETMWLPSAWRSAPKFSSRSVCVLLYARGETEVQPGLAGVSVICPSVPPKILRDKLAQLWDDPSVLGFPPRRADRR